MMRGPRAARVAMLTAALLVVLTGLNLRHALQRCRRHLTDLNRAGAALTLSAPVLHAPPVQAGSRRVVLVVVDGLAYWASRDLPTLTRLRAQGVDARADSHLPSISRPNYVSLLTGVPPAYSGVRTNQFSQAVLLDSLPHRVAAAGGRSAYVTDSAPSVAFLFPEAFDDVAYAPWAGGLPQAAMRALASDARLVVLLPGAVDACGHKRRMASQACREAALQVDRQLGALVAQLDLSRDTLIVTADHGHVRTGGHGGDERAVIEVPLVLVGAGTSA
ncbi:MAG TPA: alkaline phosphatase family protein, partial [Kofleriaceae bacterium]|nr:alkaline phosphatase family protein [Kofleriaceae bacterium]